MTLLEFVNKGFFQWFFIRLTRCEQKEISEVKLHSASLMPNGSIGLAFDNIKATTKVWYSIQGWILPLTGWSNGFRYLGKNWFIKISKSRTR